MKFRITEEEKQFMLMNLPDAEPLLEGTLGDFLIALDNLIIDKGFDQNWEPNAFNREAQQMYTDIFSRNK